MMAIGEQYKSSYRALFDVLKDDVNSKNKVLIAPVAIYSFDRGYRHELYFGGNAFYMCRLPLKREYKLGSLKKIMKNKHFRYIFVGNTIDRRFLNTDSPVWKSCNPWFNTNRHPYSLEEDLKIINRYIRSRGGQLVYKNRFGKIYELAGTVETPKKSMIQNWSFEQWSKGLPAGNWKVLAGRIAESTENTEGSKSLRIEPNEKKGTRIIRVFPQAVYKNGLKLRLRLDAKSGEAGKLNFFFCSFVKVKWEPIEPVVCYQGKGEWVTLSGDYILPPGTKRLIFVIRLLPGASKPAFVDNLSIERAD
jgi:hypothetical protein